MFWCVSRVYVLVCKACVCSGGKGGAEGAEGNFT